MSGLKRLLILMSLNLVIGTGMWLGFKWLDRRDQQQQLESAVGSPGRSVGEPQSGEPVTKLSQWPTFPSAHTGDPRISLASWHGQRFAINFWASWCTACSEERPQLARLGVEFPKSILGLGTLDSLEQITDSERQHPHPYAVAVDSEGELASSLGVDVLPQTLVFDEQGRLLRRFRGVLSAVHVDAIRLMLKPKSPARSPQHT